MISLLIYTLFSVASSQILVMTNSTASIACLTPKSLADQLICSFNSAEMNYNKNGTSISQDEFMQAVNKLHGNATVLQYLAFDSVLGRSKINSKREAAMFLAHAWTATNGLTEKHELACMTNLQSCRNKYKDTVGSAEYVFYGRGYLMLSEDTNYKNASQALFQDNRLLSWPEQVAEDECVAWGTAFYLWDKLVHDDAGVKDGKFGASTKILAADECNQSSDQTVRDEAKKRYHYYTTILKAFGVTEAAVEAGCYN